MENSCAAYICYFLETYTSIFWESLAHNYQWIIKNEWLLKHSWLFAENDQLPVYCLFSVWLVSSLEFQKLFKSINLKVIHAFEPNCPYFFNNRWELTYFIENENKTDSHGLRELGTGSRSGLSGSNRDGVKSGLSGFSVYFGFSALNHKIK